MNRRTFVRGAGLLAAGAAFGLPGRAKSSADFPKVRPVPGQRRFQSQAVEAAVAAFSRSVKDPELAWLFGNCYPHTLDTQVTPGIHAGRPDTFISTGNPDAMGLRESTAQVWPYLALITQDAPLRQLVAGVINRQTHCILQDPSASSFYRDLTKVDEPHADQPTARPGVLGRKWAVDSLCSPIRLGYHYWKITGDHQPFDAQWRQAIALTLQTFRKQQQPTGLIASAFRPGGDTTQYPFPVPGNFLAVISLRQAFLMMADIAHDDAAAQECLALAEEIAVGLRRYAIVQHPELGPVFAYETDGTGNHVLMDDANLPNLLALPYLNALPLNEPTYQNTRKLLLSTANPLFYKGRVAAGLGSPQTGAGMIWPVGLALRGLASVDDAEIQTCIQALKACHAGTGYLPQAFHQDNPAEYTHARFAGASALFGELLWKVYRERPQLLR
jgi:meiotically up-regulated gene 157 (Mug157) protein